MHLKLSSLEGARKKRRKEEGRRKKKEGFEVRRDVKKRLRRGRNGSEREV